MSSYRLSLCIPILNEAGSLPVLVSRIENVLKEIEGGPHEIVFINDGSTDETSSILDALVREEKPYEICCIHLSRNFGHQVAISAGLQAVTGDACVVMDGDLQDTPESIPSLLEVFNEGYEVVYAKRTLRKENPLLKSSYYLFYRILNLLSDHAMPVDSGDFAVISRRVIDVINSCPERNRYLRGLRAWSGFRQKGVEVERDKRYIGSSRYGMFKLLKLACDGLFSFSIIPLRLAVFFGSIGVLCSILYFFHTLYAMYVLQRTPPGFTALVLLLAIVSSLQLLSLGVLGEYIGRIYNETKKRPLYVIDRVEKNVSTSDKI
jgi:glycosyltransferase involved in cell wall biosynthesis